VINNKEKNVSTPQFKATYALQNNKASKLWIFIYLHCEIK